MRSKLMASFGMMLLVAALWGCGSNGGGGGSDVPSTGGATQPGEVGSSSCTVCHSAVVTQGWTGSAHEVAGDTNAGCEGCHGGGQFHVAAPVNVAVPVPEPSLVQCDLCHDVTVRHINGDDPATSYQTFSADADADKRVVEGYTKVDNCLGCHAGDTPAATTWEHDPENLDINRQWAGSGHAGRIVSSTPDTATVWGHYNWDQTTGTGNRGSCQRCHTATGAMNFLTSPATYNAANNDFSHLLNWTAATGSQQNELLYCWGCHSDVSTGTLRNPGAITETYAGSPTGSPSVTVNYDDVSSSNVCMGCHLGREVGEVIAVSTGDFTNLNFINSHYLTAGSTLFSESGYEYSTVTYPLAGPYPDGFHREIGVGDTANTGTSGPCVTCHMSGAESHSFEVVEKDAAGTITAVASTTCGNCHVAMTPAILEEKKAEFHEAMEALRLALEAKGIYFAESYPYFFQADLTTAFKNWDGVYPGKGKDVMGAAFNYNLFEHDPGAYAHNRTYALQLIRDSIDFLNDGLVDGDSSVASILVAEGINVSAVPGYATIHGTYPPSGDEAVCSSCHSKAPHFGGTYTGATASSGRGQYFYAGTATYPVTCSECHASNNQAVFAQYTESGHADILGDAWIHYNWKATDTNAAYGGSDRSGCARCHTSTGYKAAMATDPNSPIPPFAAASGDAADPAEILSCGACHADAGTGALRNPGPVTPKTTANPPVVLVEKADPDDAVTTPIAPLQDAGYSNVCYYCHAGGGNMFSNWSATRVASHHAVAAGTLNGDDTRLGYEFITADAPPATVYLTYAVSPHKDINITSTGPCVSCHMANEDHHFEPVDEEAQTIRGQALCDDCHGGTITFTVIEEKKAGYQAAGALLAAYINNTVQNYANVVITGAVTAHNDRAAWYNFKVFPNEEQGGFVHNPYYVRQLIFDSVDWLQDGVLNGTLTVGTGVGQIDPTTYATALAWLGTTRP